MEKTAASAFSIFLFQDFLPTWVFGAGHVVRRGISQTLARNPSLASAQSSYEATYTSQFVSLADMLPNVAAFATSTMSNTDADFTTRVQSTGSQYR